MRNTSLTNLSSARHAAFLVVILAACAPYPQRVHEEPIMVNGDRVPAVDASYAAADVANERYAIKALRGDFDGVPPAGSADDAIRARAALAAVDR